MSEPLKGRLLVASPTLLDPNFARTVVLVLDHGAEGAVGLVLNRPSETELDEPLPEWSGLAAEPRVVFVGGPVSQTAAIALGRTAGGDVDTVDLTLAPDEARGVEAVRVFAGYAGWGPGQLEAELEEGSWVVCDAEPGDALSGEPDDLWYRVLRRQGGTTAWLVHCPPDPSLN